MILLRAILFYAGLSLATIVFFPIAFLLYPFPLRLRFQVMSRWAIVNLWWLGVVCGLKHQVEGLENIPQHASIIMCKHQSAWETLALQLIFPAQVWILKRELLWIPIYGWALAAMQPIAIDRSSVIRSVRHIVTEGCKRLQEGLWVVIFPEGTRVTPGERGRYQPGGGMLAEKAGCPVVPVAHNSGYFWPRNSFKKWPGTITMVIGPPIDSRGKAAEDIMNQVEDWIESTVDRLPRPLQDTTVTRQAKSGD